METREAILDFLKTKTRLFEVVPTLQDISEKQESQVSLIRGAIQSGKSRIIHALTMYFTMVLKENMVIVLRNFSGDYEQLKLGYEKFLNEFKEFVGYKEEQPLTSVFYIGNVVRSKKRNQLTKHQGICDSLKEGGCCLLTLANVDHLRKVIECIGMVDSLPPVHMAIDEVDQLMYAEGEEFSPLFDEMVIDLSTCVFGISGTLFDNLQDGKISVKNIFDMTPPPNYKGVDSILFKCIEKVDTEIKSDQRQEFLEWDRDLFSFLFHSRFTPPFPLGKDTFHPMITLIKTERIIVNQENLLKCIMEHPVLRGHYTLITFNGSQNQVYSPHLIGKTMILPGCKKRESAKKSNSEIHVFPNTSILYILQYLKENGGATLFPRIIIIGHGLLGRGINVVSSDYEWHLTHMFYRPSSDTPVPALLQSMRLCGVYRDNIPLTCMVEKNVYENIYRGHFLQEDIFSRLKNATNENLKSHEWLTTETFHKTKIPRRRFLRKGNKFLGVKTQDITQDTGMDLKDFHRKKNLVKTDYPKTTTSTIPKISSVFSDQMSKETMMESGELPQKEFDRLTNPTNGMFKKWAKSSNQTAIARFMREGLDPSRIYNKQEITDLCKEYGVRLSCIIKLYGNDHTIGLLLKKTVDDTFYLFPSLKPHFQTFF